MTDDYSRLSSRQISGHASLRPDSYLYQNPITGYYLWYYIFVNALTGNKIGAL